jgi:hypothetical protein
LSSCRGEDLKLPNGTAESFAKSMKRQMNKSARDSCWMTTKNLVTQWAAAQNSLPAR